jgi:hypothetical protein
VVYNSIKSQQGVAASLFSLIVSGNSDIVNYPILDRAKLIIAHISANFEQLKSIFEPVYFQHLSDFKILSIGHRLNTQTFLKPQSIRHYPA